MLMFIHDIPIAFDPSLSWEEIREIAEELIHTWNWEGRKLGRIDFSRDGPWIRVYSYETPFLSLFPTKPVKE